MARIKKIKLEGGQIYSIFDEGALRLNDQGILITGNDVVDKVILDGHLSIISVDDVPVNNSITNVLVQDTTTGDIKKRSTNQLLEDIGGYTCKVSDNGTLSLQVGKQD